MTKKSKIPPQKVVIKDFDGTNVPDNFDFPAIGVEDIDRAIFNLFDKTLNFETTSKGVTTQVPVIFASGERFALTRRKKPIRDNNNTNILPLISIVRENFDIGPDQLGKKTPISFRAQPNYTIKIRLSEKDRDYQNFINKQNLKNQKNVSTENNFVHTGTKQIASNDSIASRRGKENLIFSKNTIVNLKKDIHTNIFEFIQIPYPYFIAVKYNIVFWCQYMTQANQMLEYLINKIQVPGGEFAIETESGYELVAFIDNSISFDNNFDNFTEDERLIKYNFALTVPGYILNSKIPGQPSQLRSFFSAPTIDFGYSSNSSDLNTNTNRESKLEKVERHVLTDLTSVDELSLQRGETSEENTVIVANPFTQDENSEFLRVKTRNVRTGESVISSTILKEIEKQFE